MEFPLLIIIGIIVYSGIQAAKKMTKGSVVPETQKRTKDLVIPSLPEELFLEQDEQQEYDEDVLPAEGMEVVSHYKPVNAVQESVTAKEVKKESSTCNRKIKIQSKEEARRAIIYSEIIKRKY